MKGRGKNPNAPNPASLHRTVRTVHEFEAGVDRFLSPGGGVSIDLNLPMASEDVFFIRAAEARALAGDVGRYWRAFAEWALARAGLPAPEDFGERSRTERFEDGSHMTVSFGDTPASRLHRVLERLDPNSAEAWAARIEWRFLIGGGEAEAERFAGFVTMLEMLPDARRGRDADKQRTGARDVANEKRAAAALKRDGEWARYLKRVGLFPVGVGGSVKDAIEALATKFGLDYESARDTLKKRRKVPESPLFVPGKRATKKGKA